MFHLCQAFEQGICLVTLVALCLASTQLYAARLWAAVTVPKNYVVLTSVSAGLIETRYKVFFTLILAMKGSG